MYTRPGRSTPVDMDGGNRGKRVPTRGGQACNQSRPRGKRPVRRKPVAPPSRAARGNQHPPSRRLGTRGPSYGRTPPTLSTPPTIVTPPRLRGTTKRGHRGALSRVRPAPRTPLQKIQVSGGQAESKNFFSQNMKVIFPCEKKFLRPLTEAPPALQSPRKSRWRIVGGERWALLVCSRCPSIILRRRFPSPAVSGFGRCFLISTAIAPAPKLRL